MDVPKLVKQSNGVFPENINRDYLIISTNFNFSPNDDVIEQIVSDVYYELTKTNKKGICYDTVGEGFCYGILYICNLLTKKLIKKCNLSLNQFLLVSSSVGVEENVILYEKHCKTFGWLNIPLLLIPNHELIVRSSIHSNLSRYNKINDDIKVKSKKFLCFNRAIRDERLYLMGEFIRRNLWSQAYISFLWWPDPNENLSNAPDKLKNTWHLSMAQILSNLDKFPLVLTSTDISMDLFYGISEEDVKYYNDSYFTVITETKYFQDPVINVNINDYDAVVSQLGTSISLDAFYFTEKTYRTIAGKSPFILAGYPRALQILRKTGYKTFHPYIDETYDTIDDDEERMIAITNEVERLCKMSDNEFVEWQKHIYPIVLHNFNRLVKGNNYDAATIC